MVEDANYAFGCDVKSFPWEEVKNNENLEVGDMFRRLGDVGYRPHFLWRAAGPEGTLRIPMCRHGLLPGRIRLGHGL